MWFAFNSVYLNYQKQHNPFTPEAHISCDLLSIQYIWTTRNNYCFHCLLFLYVVICFLFSIFELPETTFCKYWSYAISLWFAFNSVYLNYQKQLKGAKVPFGCRCDLLSIQYIWTTRNNKNLPDNLVQYVVICFQFSIFELPETTILVFWHVM